MKTSFLALASVLMISGLACADTPPVPGSKIQSQVTDAPTAQILYDSLTENEQKLPVEYVVKSQCGNVTVGKVHIAKSTDGTTKVVCSAFYCMGHRSVCNLEEVFN